MNIDEYIINNNYNQKLNFFGILVCILFIYTLGVCALGVMGSSLALAVNEITDSELWHLIRVTGLLMFLIGVYVKVGMEFDKKNKYYIHFKEVEINDKLRAMYLSEFEEYKESQERLERAKEQ